MNFFDMCYDLFISTSKYRDLSKDINDYNKIVYYLHNFATVDRTEIENFIIKVRMDNLVYSVLCQILKIANSKKWKRLDQLDPYELYIELQGEITNIVLKGALDSFKILNNLTQQQVKELAKRIASGDVSIFNEYVCK